MVNDIPKKKQKKHFIPTLTKSICSPYSRQMPSVTCYCKEKKKGTVNSVPKKKSKKNSKKTSYLPQRSPLVNLQRKGKKKEWLMAFLKRKTKKNQKKNFVLTSTKSIGSPLHSCKPVKEKKRKRNS